MTWTEKTHGILVVIYFNQQFQGNYLRFYGQIDLQETLFLLIFLLKSFEARSYPSPRLVAGLC